MFPAPSRWTNRGTPQVVPWSELSGRLATPELWPATESVRTSEEQLPGWTFAAFRDAARIAGRDLERSERESADRVVAVHGLVVEYVDEPAVDAEHLTQWWSDYAFLAYTTAFHDHQLAERPPGPRWRLLVPFARAASREEAVLVAQWARHPRRRAGIVDAATEAPWRVVAVPAINPGRYRSALHDGVAIDPDAAIRQLAEWEVTDRREAAAATLSGTSITDAVGDLLSLARHPPSVVHWPWPQVERLVGPLFPGRVVLVVTADARLRTTLLLTAALDAAESGAHVLFAATNAGRSELAARLLALRAEVPATDLLTGACSAEAVEAAGARLGAAYPRVHLWAPGRGERTLAALEREARALVHAGDGRPPVLVLDPVEGWDDAHSAAEGRRAFAAVLGDLARSGGLDPGWPGALVVAGSATPDPMLASADALRTAWRGDPASVATRVATDEAELDFASSVVVAAAADPIGETRRVVVAVVRNSDGGTGIDELEWKVDTGRVAETSAVAG
jgi:hypothetical protein